MLETPGAWSNCCGKLQAVSGVNPGEAPWVGNAKAAGVRLLRPLVHSVCLRSQRWSCGTRDLPCLILLWDDVSFLSSILLRNGKCWLCGTAYWEHVICFLTLIRFQLGIWSESPRRFELGFWSNRWAMKTMGLVEMNQMHLQYEIKPFLL